MPKEKTYRFWCFTINNPDEIPDLEEIPHVRYAIMQLEEGENHTPHYQGYIECKRGIRLAALKKWHDTAHFEPRRGTAEEAREYCRKAEGRLEEPIEFGCFGLRQGDRSDLLAIKKKLDAGQTLRTVARIDEHFGPFIKYHGGLSRYVQMLDHKRDWKTVVTVIYGEPGSGKTRSLHTLYPDAYWIAPPKKKNDPVWVDGYYGQETIIIDEFTGWIPFNNFKLLLDRYPYQMETKGGFVHMLPREIFITTNSFPQYWYKNEFCRNDWSAIVRRVDRWVLMMKNENPETFFDWNAFVDYCYAHPGAGEMIRAQLAAINNFIR